MNTEPVPLIVTVVLAFVGYFATYFYRLQLAKRESQLELIDKRIKDFYGPLYIRVEAGRVAYESLLSKLGRPLVFDPRNPPTDQQLREWRIWSKNVFGPLNDFLENLILENAYLIREEEMPECLIRFMNFQSENKAMLAKWEQGDFSETVPRLDFPDELGDYAVKSYRQLKSDQLRLIGQLRQGASG